MRMPEIPAEVKPPSARIQAGDKARFKDPKFRAVFSALIILVCETLRRDFHNMACDAKCFLESGFYMEHEKHFLKLRNEWQKWGGWE